MKQTVVENINPIEFKQIIDSYGAKDIFLVTGKASFHKTGALELIKPLITQGTKFHHFSEFDVNPNYDDVIKGFNLFCARKCDLILAVGGGSVIDVAKCINAFQSHSDTDKKDLVQNNLILNKGVPLIAIPTTAGSGSEATHFAVIYLEKLKYSLAHSSLLPELVVLNSEYTLSQSNYLTACSGLDALAQAIESFWSINSTEESREYSKKSIELILPNLEKSVNERDETSRKLVFLGAHYAGKAINIAKTTAPHAISYFFTKFHNIPHGHAVFLTLPFFYKYNASVDESNCNDPRGVEYIRNSFSELNDLIGFSSVSEAYEILSELPRRIGIDCDFRNLKIEFNYSLLRQYVNVDRLSNNPRRFDFHKSGGFFHNFGSGNIYL